VNGWTDAHCHLQDQFLADDVDHRHELAATLERAVAAGVDRVVIIGTDLRTSREALSIASSLESPVELFATVGLHPHEAVAGTDPIGGLARGGGTKLVGIGECGLDYYYEHSPRAVQLTAFAEQVRLAHELDLALVIHARDAWDDLFDVLRDEGVPPRTVIHCFTGGPTEAARCLEMGCDISIAGVVTFKNAEELREALRVVPLSRLHVETDSPFLAPVPLRGRTNEPANVAVVGNFVAGVLGLGADELRAATAANSARLFALTTK
jgi:TatD DNase family protein